MKERIKLRYQERSTVLKALSHPVRLFIAEELAKGERCVSELARSAGSGLPTVSRHLMLLRNVSVVTSRKEKLRVFYRLESSSLDLIFSAVEKILEGRTRTMKYLFRTQNEKISKDRRNSPFSSKGASVKRFHRNLRGK